MFLSLKQSFLSSIKSLTSNKTRSFLTMLGIIIGVSAVIVIIAVGAGAQSLILGQIEGIGTNLVSITPGKSDDNGPPTSVMGIIVTSLDDRDLKSLEDNKDIIGISSVSGGASASATASWSSNFYSSNLEGVNSSYFDMNDFNLVSGRFFTEEENNNLSRLVVLGSNVKDELFGDFEAVGERIRVKNNTYEVVGVLDERGQVFFQNIDDNIFIPVKT
ncbi:MAG: ABC transporter permease, partial [Patescibacteria group bacterium]